MPPGAALAGSAVGGIVGNIIQGNASNDAAAMQSAAAQQANGIQSDIYKQTKGAWSPYQQAGTAALSQLQDPSLLKSFSMQDYQQDPGYQFRLSQGQQALDRSAAARGHLLSGAQLKAVSDYNQGAASQEYQNAYNRFNNDQSNRFARLSQLTGYGTMGNQAVDQAGQNYANMASQNLMGAANAQAGARMQQGQGWANTLSGLGNLGMQGAMMNSMGLFKNGGFWGGNGGTDGR